MSDDEAILVAFTLSDGLYGVEVDQVREITAMRDISPVPNSPDYVVGVTNLRGQVTTVTDLKQRLGLFNEAGVGKNSRIIIVESDETSVGMAVDSVREVMRIPRGDIEPVPDVVSEFNVGTEYIRGVGKLDGGDLIVLLDMEKVLAEE
ncbi:MAG: chemotaxis protein CheW [Methanosarcinales archaeon]|nr:chemotaxis protein CheW [Methanosarcinales archaeon]